LDPRVALVPSGGAPQSASAISKVRPSARSAGIMDDSWMDHKIPEVLSHGHSGMSKEGKVVL